MESARMHGETHNTGPAFAGKYACPLQACALAWNFGETTTEPAPAAAVGGIVTAGPALFRPVFWIE
jgi:hypothetical protein